MRKKLWFIILLFVCLFTFVDLHDTKECLNIRDLSVEHGGHHCCKDMYKQFRRAYHNSNLRLTSFLEKLSAWNCSQFEEECEHRYFDFNQFTSLVYDRFCNVTAFEENCRLEMKKWNETYHSHQHLADSRYLMLNFPCRQVQAYHYGQPYYELARPITPFCSSVWCGFGEDIASNNIVSVWMCYPNSCRIRVIIVMVVCGILAVATVILNLTIIIVLRRDPKYPTNQMIYKMSLAIGDLLIGFFVLPSFIATKFILEVGQEKNLSFVDHLDETNVSTQAFLGTKNETNLIHSLANTYFLPKTPYLYKEFFGCITTLSFLVSVYSLLFAAYDRYQALNAPLKHIHTSVKRAQIETVCLWIVSLILSILPAFVPGLTPYRIVAGGVLITVFEEASAILIGIFFGLPFIGMWVLTIRILVILKQNRKIRQNIRAERRGKQSDRGGVILAMMVGVFTASIIPVLIFGLVPEFVPTVIPQNVKILNVNTASTIFALELAATILLASNSLWNCFIYSFRNKDFRSCARTLYYQLGIVLGIVPLYKKIKKGLTCK